MSKTETKAERTRKHECPSCGRDGRVYIAQNPTRAIIACPNMECSMAENEEGQWVFYVGGITEITSR